MKLRKSIINKKRKRLIMTMTNERFNKELFLRQNLYFYDLLVFLYHSEHIMDKEELT